MHPLYIQASAKVRMRKADKDGDATEKSPGKKSVGSRSNSSVFSMFSQPQIQEFKEVNRIQKKKRTKLGRWRRLIGGGVS